MTIKIYDPSTGGEREATQADYDFLLTVVQKLIVRPIPITPDKRIKDFNFQLAIYPNPVRGDGVFIAEQKPIEPYQGISNLDGSKVYSALPNTEFRISHQLPYEFAWEIVRRWNNNRD